MICDKCLHADVCGEEGSFEPSLTYCSDFLGWVSVSGRTPGERVLEDGWVEPSDYVLVQMRSGLMHVSRYWSRYKGAEWMDLSYPTTDEVIAWMPLPAPYEP